MPSRDDIRSLSTEQRWIPPSTVRRDALTPESRNDLIFRKVRGILNKLTPEKFAKLSNDLLNVELNSHVILKGVIFLIFEKALDEPKYSSMYARLCKQLSDEAANFEPRKPIDESQKGQSTFRVLLLNKCKDEFENRSKASEAFENQDELGPEEEERRQVAKRKMLGNIKFIGELGKLGIVSESILHRCIQQLLEKKRRGGSRGDAAEDIECLCQIMRTCGRILDSDKGRGLMDQYFKRMNSLVESRDLPLRIKFMLRDVIELRRDDWKPRKATSTEGPMPINQIRNDNEEPSRGNGFHRGREDRLGAEFLRKMGRGGLDVEMMGSIPLTSPSFGMPPPPFSPNGFAGTPGVGYGRHNQRNQPGGGYYPNQNRHQNNYEGKRNQPQHNLPQNFNNNSNKEQLRFNKNKMLIGGHPEEVSLRPSANSMMFKQTNINLNLPLNNDLFPGRGSDMPLLRATALKPSSPLLHKETPPAIVIKQGPVDKREKARDRKDKGPTREEVLKKVNALMDDLASHTNVQDALTAFKDLKIPERFLRHAICTMYSNTLDRGDSERELAAKLVAELKKENLFTLQQVSEGWKELVASISEKESTVPLVASHVALLTAKAIVDNLIQLTDLASETENGRHHPLFLLTLQQLHKTQGKARLTQIFNDSKVDLISQLPEAEKTKERLGEILEDRELTFLYPLLRIQGDMWRQLEADPAPNALYKWIKEKLDPQHHSDPAFINAMMNVLFKYITGEITLAPGVDPTVNPDKQLQEKESALLQKYARFIRTFLTTIDSQVTALHALQVFCFSHNFPKGLLLRWFIALYNLEVIEEEAYHKWRDTVTDAYPGKGKALFQVNSWLTWLAEASEEEEEDDEDEKN
ncbi:PREDICTED: eukaryotic translation initiation factor 4 gamma 2 isoform X1 [Cyphomyrmex costatus]|uniref:eukaryotic translation initiation factor 4 gamma 2 isoform X1 n=2 Tax=Cyphomyrmex costatus TaxID=456900 RepID=UPI0008523F28|nr:PREDICTED: eukaryotic translation initiation factor 4 gamma 2 isoform X1 [Cyphomyrmex costatus]XP_018400149.1 PREDICTED: eukaryotic translation initiation factor 4 gamma 2 isoform X1 [Cyphomyrmex costatus]XP_018400150.1 PREDICTED: eukaryotic translation initiation factor 4 gamma 2 isoform X1 [Cyphomyrmex costatus]XP_018400151.1 PREDICTED: eukaryotic translation initiation factor 4 gamma 2 isoform X1 [Cyphomyrmex costatus]